MSAPQLIVDGKQLRLGKRIGKGGEGEVYALADGSSHAIKYYTDGVDREAKISAIVRLGLAEQSALVAFPLAVARDTAGRFKGFVMRLVRDHQPIFELYSPSARKQQFPEADYRFLTRAAVNTARAVAAVHESGCVIGDINHSGILISKNATAALIDADSFQVTDGAQRFLCRVGVPEYTPPELQSSLSLSTVVRTPNHDAFGLAIVIFQLLAMGRHPFVGVYSGSGDMPIQKAISEFRFAYSERRSVGMTPPPGACTLSSFTPQVATAFEAAFGQPQREARPPAKQWVALLEEFERTLVKCKSNSLHHYSSAASRCPWCNMEQRLGMVLFVPSFADPTVIPTGFATNFNLPLIWAQVLAVKLPPRAQLNPVLPQLNLNPSPEVLKAEHDVIQPYIFYCAAAFFVVVGLTAGQPVFLLIALIVFGLKHFQHDAKGQFVTAQLALLNELGHRWYDAINDWERRCGLEKVEDLKASAEETKAAYEALKPEEARRIESYQSERQSIQINQFLEAFRIRDQKIHGIGPAKLATLASYGIETAAHITRARVLNVPGFGPTNSLPLFEWQRECATEFKYRPEPTPADRIEIGKIKTDIRRRAAELEQKLTREAREFIQAAQGCQRGLANPDPLLKLLHEKRSQIETDLAHLKVSIPARPARKRPPPNYPSTRKPPTWTQKTQRAFTFRPPQTPMANTQTPSCPSCGSTMRRRTARRGSRAGKPFWGCSRFPGCRGTRPI